LKGIKMPKEIKQEIEDEEVYPIISYEWECPQCGAVYPLDVDDSGQIVVCHSGCGKTWRIA